MISQLKTFTRKMAAGANVATIAVMLLVGFSDYVNPASHPILSLVGLTFPFLLIINLGFLIFWLIFCKRMAIIPFLGFIVAYAPVHTYIPFNIPHDTPIGAIKVMSYNVHGFNGRGSEHNPQAPEDIINYFKKTKPDILCLQEDCGWIQTTIENRMDSIFAHHDKAVFGESLILNGISIYSRFPIIKKETIPYESKGNGSCAFYLDINGKTVVVVNNHFESNCLTADDKTRYKTIIKKAMEGETAKSDTRYIATKLAEASKRRAPQVDAVHEYVERIRKKYPVIVTGDFNDNPISYTRRVMAKGLTDCYVETARGLGLSYNQKGFFVRIDNIMCSDHFIPYNCHVDDKITASDHNPIISWLKFGYKP